MRFFFQAVNYRLDVYLIIIRSIYVIHKIRLQYNRVEIQSKGNQRDFTRFGTQVTYIKNTSHFLRIDELNQMKGNKAFNLLVRNYCYPNQYEPTLRWCGPF